MITNLPDSHVEQVEARCFPPGREPQPDPAGSSASPSSSTYSAPFSKVLYIEASDFKAQVRVAAVRCGTACCCTACVGVCEGELG